MDKQLILTENMQKKVAEFSDKLSPELFNLFENCYKRTWLSTMEKLEDGSTFVITGDIPAMWLRDSSQQVFHYLPLTSDDIVVQNTIKGVIRRQITYILIDPYANAFNRENNCNGHPNDITAQSPWVWERKYEVDSLCYPIRLAYTYWKKTGSKDIFDDNFKRAVITAIDLWKREQRHTELSAYRFERKGCAESDSLGNNGLGSKVGYTGMTWSGFRPSDDACQYGYLIPSNMFAATVLGYIEEIMHSVYGDKAVEKGAQRLKQEIDAGVKKYGIYHHETFGDIYAYEVDGLGHYNLMDDANVPGLLSLPYLECCDTGDTIYRNTRKFILSKQNPYYYEGKSAKGIGSPHTPKGYIWHIGLIMQALTSTDKNEIHTLLKMLETTHAGTGNMHESFLPDDPSRYTRQWFALADSLFSELILKIWDK